MYRRVGQRGIENIREFEVAIVVYLAETFICALAVNVHGPCQIAILLGKLFPVAVVLVRELVVVMDIEGLWQSKNGVYSSGRWLSLPSPLSFSNMYRINSVYS